MPRSTDGKPIAARDYNRSNGFSPGQILVTLVPRLDLKRTGAAPVTDVGRSLRRRQAIVDRRETGRRQLIWSELNSIPENPSKRTLNIHPGIGWREGHRYIVALRNLRRGNGRVIGRAAPSASTATGCCPARASSTAGGPTWRTSSAASARPACAAATCIWPGTSRSRAARAHQAAAVDPRPLVRPAWRHQPARLRGRRRRAALRRDGGAPGVWADRAPRERDGRRALLARPARLPARLALQARPPWLPRRSAGNVQKARFVCIVPASSATTPARPLLFGHGLFQDETRRRRSPCWPSPRTR